MSLSIPAAEFKRKFSDFLGRVIHRNEHLIITRHGKPVAEISPIGETPHHLSQVKGWLEDSDPLFRIVDTVIADRLKHPPRAWSDSEE